MTQSSDFAAFWNKLERARKDHGRYNDLNKLIAAIGSSKGNVFSRSTWYSYQREMTGRGSGTSPTVSFLSRVAGLLGGCLTLDLELEIGKGTHLNNARGGPLTRDENVRAIMEVLAHATPEVRQRLRELVVAEVVGMASNPQGGDDDGRPLSPK